MRELILVTGAIGAGKTTFVHMLYKYNFINDYEYVSTDLYYYMYFKDCLGEEQDKYAKAKKYANYKLNKILQEGRCLIWETVVAKKDKIDWLQCFKKEGYKISVIYLKIDNDYILESHSQKRIQEGWYRIPYSKIHDRHLRIENYKPIMKEIADNFYEIEPKEKDACSN